MKKLILIVTMMVMSTLSIMASEQSFYFIAKASNEGVYLRWDAIDGNFPKNSDVKQIVLRRNDVNITSFNPNSIMNIGQIEALYGKPSNQKSLMKMISSISKNDDAVCSGANLANYASKIKACMQNNMWRYMASKVDFNIASIGYRAYLDTEAISNPTSYELLAVNDANVTERLGKVVVNPNATTSILGATNFKQIAQRKSCNAPEYAKDDYTVALSWENGGAKTDAFANSIMLSGYDLYRVIGSEIEHPTSDISSLVSSATVDANGDYIFAGLEKVNEVPLLLSNSVGEEETLFLETKDQLKKAGLKPGDKRWYYLVSKDFTGQYGPSIKLQVIIPDLLAPATPWGVRIIEHDKKAKLIWQKINVANYVKYHKNSRKFCNVETLTSDERLRFVDKDGTCGTKEIEVNLNVDKYYVYRFDNPAEAAKFVDSDLDGIGDLDEAEGKVCEALPLNGEKLELPLVKIIDANKFRNKEFITFVDEGVRDSKYYWYRIVAATDGIAYDTGSIMTAPIRAMIPNRTLPQKIEVELKACASQYIVASYSFDGNLEYLAYDKTGLAKKVKLTGLITLSNGTTLDASHGIYLPVGDDGLVKYPLKWGNCQFGTIEFLDKKDNVLASKTLCSNPFGSNDTPFIGTSSCNGREFYVLSENDCQHNGLEKVNDGQNLYVFPILVFPSIIKEGECFELTQTVMGKRYKVATVCDKVERYDTKDLNLSNLGKGEKFCLGVNVFNANNQYSPTTYLPCFGVVDKRKPNRPDMRTIKVNENNISLSWVSPQEKIASTVVSLYNQDNKSQSYLRTFSHPDHINTISMEKLSMSRDITGTLNSENRTQEWCAKVKSIGFNGEFSEWSSEKCTQNSDDGIEIESLNLAWPKIEEVNGSGVIEFSYYSDSRVIHNNISSMLKSGKFSRDKSKSISMQIEENLQSMAVNSIFYRQSKKNGVWSNYLQVSPLINRIKVIRVITSYTNNAGILAMLELENNLRVSAYYSNSDKIPYVTWTLFYNDDYPFSTDTTYRYVKVDFDKNHEIRNYTVSNEVTTTQGGE